MHSSIFLIFGCAVIASFAQTYDITTSVSATSSIADDCVTYGADCTTSITTSAVPALNTTSPLYSLTNSTTLTSNLSTTMVTVSTSASSGTFLNTSSTLTANSQSVPTSILAATGEPTVPGGGITVTSYQVIMASSTSTGSATNPTAKPANAGKGKAVSMSGIAVALLGLSSLLLA